MVISLPSRIMNYNVSAASPTDELLTLGQILSEVGDYASTVLDHDHLSLSRKCGTRLRKVVGELKARNSHFSVEGLYDILPEKPGLSDKSELAMMTVSELHYQYRRWPLRHKERTAKGRERLTFYYEGRIVRELLHRKAANKGEQFKIDYCVATYKNELENLSFIFRIIMGLFYKKKHYSFADILKGIQHAVNSAQDMLQGQQIQNIEKFLEGTNGAPVSQKVRLGDREVEVPLMSLVPQCHLAMEDVEIKFNAKVGEVASGTLQGIRGNDISHADLQMALEGVHAKDDDVMQITIRFRQQQTTEGVSRLMDEYNKLI